MADTRFEDIKAEVPNGTIQVNLQGKKIVSIPKQEIHVPAKIDGLRVVVYIEKNIQLAQD